MTGLAIFGAVMVITAFMVTWPKVDRLIEAHTHKVRVEARHLEALARIAETHAEDDRLRWEATRPDP